MQGEIPPRLWRLTKLTDYIMCSDVPAIGPDPYAARCIGHFFGILEYTSLLLHSDGERLIVALRKAAVKSRNEANIVELSLRESPTVSHASSGGVEDTIRRMTGLTSREQSDGRHHWHHGSYIEPHPP